jgi:hypothetical protein
MVPALGLPDRTDRARGDRTQIGPIGRAGPDDPGSAPVGMKPSVQWRSRAQMVAASAVIAATTLARVIVRPVPLTLKSKSTRSLPAAVPLVECFRFGDWPGGILLDTVVIVYSIKLQRGTSALAV